MFIEELRLRHLKLFQKIFVDARQHCQEVVEVLSQALGSDFLCLALVFDYAGVSLCLNKFAITH